MKNKNQWSLIMSALSLAGVTVLLVLQLSLNEKQIAYVDTSKLVANYQGMIVAKKEYQKKVSVWSANIDSLKQEVNGLISSFNKEEKTLSRKEKSLQQELIKSKQAQLAQYQEAIQTKAQQEDARMTQEVVAEINSFIKIYATQNGFDLILGATPNGNIAYAEEAMDVTDDLLKLLNQTAE